MNCEHVQDAIWCGEELTPEMHQHLATCQACQTEQRHVQNVSFSMEKIAVPMQTRSLLPSLHEIEGALAVRKRRRASRWALGAVCAAAVVLLAVALPSMLSSKQAPNTSLVSLQPTTPDATGQNIGSGNAGQNPTAGVGTTPITPPTGAKEPTTTTPEKSLDVLVTVSSSVPTQYQAPMQAVANYLKQNFDRQLFASFQVLNFKPDTWSTDRELDGAVTLQVEHQPGQVSAYGAEQVVKVDRFVRLLKNNDGSWQTPGTLATSPYFPEKKTVRTDLYQFQAPKVWTTTANSDGFLRFAINGQVVGGIDPTNLYPHEKGQYLDAIMLPNHADTIKKELVVDGYPMPAVRAIIKRDPAAVVEPGGNTGSQETHLFLIDPKNDNLSFDVWFYSDVLGDKGKIDPTLYAQMIQSFEALK